jgi:membrane protein YdbS with pleckstrin-like domain
MTVDSTTSSGTINGGASAVPATPVPAYGAVEYQPLHPKVLRLWQLGDLIAYLVLLLMGLLAAVLVAVKWPRAMPWAATAWGALVLLGVWTIFYYHPRNYRAWGYRVDQRVLLIKRGVWFRTIKLLPLPRLQHVDVKRGPLQRQFGLATLVLHTAGTHAAEIEVPGLDAEEAFRLRDRLVAAGGDDGV